MKKFVLSVILFLAFSSNAEVLYSPDVKLITNDITGQGLVLASALHHGASSVRCGC